MDNSNIVSKYHANQLPIFSISLVFAQGNTEYTYGTLYLCIGRTTLPYGTSASYEGRIKDGTMWQKWLHRICVMPPSLDAQYNLQLVNFPFICSNSPAAPAYGVFAQFLVFCVVFCAIVLSSLFEIRLLMSSPLVSSNPSDGSY